MVGLTGILEYQFSCPGDSFHFGRRYRDVSAYRDEETDICTDRIENYSDCRPTSH